MALGDESQDLLLALGEQRADRQRLAARDVRVLPQQVARERRRDDRAAAVHGDHRMAQFTAADAFGQIARRAGADRLQQRFGLLAGRHDQHA